MRNHRRFLFCILALFISAGTAQAQDPIIYPAQGQTQEQLDKDKYDCYNWAKQQTGVDPMQAQQATAQAPQQPQRGGAARGALGGAIVGTTIGAITGRPGRGAHIGAVTGGVAGGARQAGANAQQQQAQQQHAQQQAAAYAQSRDGYNRAHGACMEGRGYVVK